MKKFLPILLLILVALLSVRAFFMRGFIPTHDGEYHIVRQWQFSKVIQSGDLFPIWTPDLNSGYGVPLFEFFYRLSSFVGHIFVLFGFSFIDSFKLTIATGVIVSAFTFYLWVRCFFKTFPAVVSSTAYVLAPYHTLDASVRGSVGEIWSLALAPLVLFAITKMLMNKNNEKAYLFLFVISSVLLLISHNVLGFLFFILIFIYGFLFCFFHEKSLKIVIVGLIYSLSISCFFWLPLIFESSLVNGLAINYYADHFPVLSQFIIPSWGTGFSVPGPSDQMSFQIGLIHIFVSGIAMYIAIKRKDIFIFSLSLIMIGSIFLMLNDSIFIWKILSPIQIIQFPWRLLSVTIVFASFLIAYVSEQSRRATWIILILSLIFYMPYTMPVIYEPREDKRYIENPEWINGTTTWGNTFTVKGFVRPDPVPQDEFIVVEGNGTILEGVRKTNSSYATIQANSDLLVEVKRAYFPGWQVIVDGKTHEMKQTKGIVQFTIAPGAHDIKVIFGQSTIRRQAYSLSLIASVLLITYTSDYWIRFFKMFRKQPKNEG